MEGSVPEPWGPVMAGRTRFRLLHRVVSLLGMVALVSTAAVGTTAFMLYREYEENRTVIALEGLDVPLEASAARHFLLVGSDGRDGLTAEDRRQLALGSFDGQRSDTMIYVAVSADRSQVSLISLPRDLLVVDEAGRRRKLTDVYAGGEEALVAAVQSNFGLPVNHYAQISLGGFLDVVETLGGVELCLDEPLVDRKAGADLAAGCLERTPAEALAFVRSRSGSRSDFQRIDRQQVFLRAVLGELSELAILTNPRRLFQLVEDLSDDVTTDAGLGLSQIRYLANDLRSVVGQGVPMTVVPSYAQRIGNGDYVLLYRPGAEAMFAAIRSGEPLADRGTPEQRAETRIALSSGGRVSGASVVERTLFWSGFDDTLSWAAPPEMAAAEGTVVFPARTGKTTQAGWVAALLGAEVRELPPGVEVPPGLDVVVSVGLDADPAGWS